MRKAVMVLWIGSTLSLACWAVPIVSNVKMQQIEGTKLVQITYDVADDVNTQLWASVSISTNGVALPSNSVTGDVAVAMTPGNGKTIIWDAGADWNGRYTEIAEAVVDVVAYDSESICIGCDLAFTYNGNATWDEDRTVYYSPALSLRSGTVSHGQYTTLLTSVSGSGTLSFMWKVSSEDGSDELFANVDGTVISTISGEVDWQKVTYTISGTGTHTIFWRYLKNGSGSSGADCGWIDDACFIQEGNK